MIRPRIGDFVYSENEILLMTVEIEQFAKCRVRGVVFGVLTPAGTVDVELMRNLALFASSNGLEGDSTASASVIANQLNTKQSAFIARLIWWRTKNMVCFLL